MISLTYHTSTGLIATLDAIENIRRTILVTPLSPKEELTLQWETRLTRLSTLSALEKTPVSKTDLLKLLTGTSQKQATTIERSILAYKETLDMIHTEWLVNNNPVTPTLIDILAEKSLCESTRVTRAELKQFLDYLQIKQENPVIQSGLAFLYTWTKPLFPDSRERMTMLLTYLFLAKSGYDIRGLLSIEELWKKNATVMQRVMEQTAKTDDTTEWLEQFAQAFHEHLVIISQRLTRSHEGATPTRFFNLNDRQHRILSFLENPMEKITNKNVQKLYRISHITAARDLGKLVVLGLVYPHGKGRSVYYTRV